MREGFLFYRSFAQAMNGLPAEDYKKLMLILIDYALDGVEPEEMSGIAESMFILMKPQIDANNRRYENGRKGGRPKKTRPEKPVVETRAEEYKTGEPMPEELRKKWSKMLKND